MKIVKRSIEVVSAAVAVVAVVYAFLPSPAEVELGAGVVAVRQTRGHSPHDRSPRDVGGVNTAHVAVAVADVDAHCAAAVAAGACVLEPLEDKFYGLRTYTAEDCEGHRWTFESRLAGPAPEEMRWKRNEGRA